MRLFFNWALGLRPVGSALVLLLSDVRYAMRLMRRKAFQTILAVVTLAIGIAGVTAAISIVYAALIEPLPYSDASELVRITVDSNRDGRPFKADPSLEQIAAWKTNAGVFADIGAAQPTGAVVITDGEPVRTKLFETWMVTPSYFDVLGVQSVIGRSLAADDARESAPDVALIGYYAFKNRFGGDHSILGRTLHFRERGKAADNAVIVVGVLPKWFWRDVVFVFPMKRQTEFQKVVGRLRDGITASDAEARLSASVAAGPLGLVRLSSLEQESSNERNPISLYLLTGAGCLVLLLACVNVGALGLSSGFMRDHEIRIRSAMGATRGRVISQIVTESVVLAAVAAVAGLLLNLLFLDWLAGSFDEQLLATNSRPGMNSTVLIAVTCIVVLTGIAVGIWPALRMSRVRLGPSPTNGIAGRISSSNRAGQSVLAIQAALTVVVMIGCGLLVRSYVRMVAVDPGFDTERVISLNVTPVDQDDEATIKFFYPALLSAIRRLPSVAAAGLTTAFRTTGTARAGIEGSESSTVGMRQITPGFLEAIGVSIQQGQLPNDSDTASCNDCIVLSETASRRWFGNQIAVGQELKVSGKMRRVIAVVSDVNFAAPFVSKNADVYVLMGAIHPPATSIVVRARGRSADVAAAVTSLVSSVGPRAVVDRVRTGVGLLDDRVAAQEQKAILAAVVGLISLGMACVGVLAVTGYAVTRRVREMGIRLALGATPRAIIGRVVLGTCLPVVAGILVGCIVAFVATRVLAELLFGVAPTDLPTYGHVAGTFTVCAVAAAYFPARRAARSDPLAALRSE